MNHDRSHAQQRDTWTATDLAMTPPAAGSERSDASPNQQDMRAIGIKARIEDGNKHRIRATLRRWRAVLLPLLSFLVILGAWQLSASLSWINPITTSSPRAIAVQAYQFLPSAEGLNDIRVSAEEFGIGLGLAILVGVFVGLLTGWYRVFEELTSLVINVFYSLPIIALAPLFVLWFGIGITSKVAIVFITALLPIMVNTLTGVKNIDPTLFDVARAFEARPRQIWWSIVLPASIPSIIAGIRLGIIGGLIGVVVGEFVVSSAGLGYLVDTSANSFNITLMFVGLLVIGLSALLLTTVLKLIEARFNRWRVQ